MKNHTKTIFYNWCSAVITTITIVFSVFFLSLTALNIAYIKTHVRGFSMYPTLNANVLESNVDGDLIYVSRFKEFNRGDIVVAETKWYDEAVIKRVIGFPNDTIEIVEKSDCYELLVNDAVVYTKSNTDDVNEDTDEYFDAYKAFLVNPQFKNNVKVKDDGTTKYIQLGDDEYFLMGDNWGHTTDSIFKGVISKSQIIGRVDFVVDYKENKFMAMIKIIFELLFNVN